MSIIVWDTETTGLLVPEISGLDKQPYIIELYAIKLDDDLNVCEHLQLWCKPSISIPDEVSNIHGYTNEFVKDKKPFIGVWREFAEFVLGARSMVGHNLQFDKQVLYYELQRINKHLNFPWPPGAVCTVEEIQKQKGYRMNLNDLHAELFGRGIEGAHHGAADVEATVNVYKEMVKREWIT
jgi:DNA polymerase-3 subunit epsilon